MPVSKPVQNKAIKKEKFKSLQDQMEYIPVAYQGLSRSFDPETAVCHSDSGGDTDSDGDEIPLAQTAASLRKIVNDSHTEQGEPQEQEGENKRKNKV